MPRITHRGREGADAPGRSSNRGEAEATAASRGERTSAAPTRRRTPPTAIRRVAAEGDAEGDEARDALEAAEAEEVAARPTEEEEVEGGEGVRR